MQNRSHETRTALTGQGKLVVRDWVESLVQLRVTGGLSLYPASLPLVSVGYLGGNMFRLLLFIFGYFLVPSAAMAGTKNPFRVEATNAEVVPGEAGAVSVIIRVPNEHHLYKDMMSVGVLKSESVVVGEAVFPPGMKKADPADPTSEREQYDMDVVIELPVTGPSKLGEYPITLLVEYQGCKKSLCWMPQTEQVDATVKVVEKK